MAQYVNANEFRVIGMSRSGNHAVIQWIMAQATGRICFLNCVEGRYNPFWTARHMDDGRRCHVNFGDFDLYREQEGRLAPKDYLIFSHEDAFLGYACHQTFERDRDVMVGPSRRRLDVLILRDPFNLFASRRRSPQGLVPPAEAARIWKQHAREFLSRPSRLRRPCILISFNRWFTDSAYRRWIAHRLNLSFTDAGLRRVPPCNGGSSFDGRSYDGQADRMKVLERWRHYARDPGFRALFDADMVRLSERIFGPIAGTRVLASSASFRRAG